MEDDLDANVIKNTQLSLGKYVKRPPLSDKLLRKPPFRFLHDIVTSVLKSKGFFEGLFEENELVSENVKDRESKISFLTKVIAVVSLTTGKTLTVKPSKIVAGQEPAKTNELLQCLAHALDHNLSSDDAVKQFKSEGKSSLSNDKKNKDSVKPAKKNVESKKLTSRSNDKLIPNEKDGQSQNKSKSRDITAHKKESPPKKSTSKTSSKSPLEKSNQEGKKKNTNEQKNVISNQKAADDVFQHNQQQIAAEHNTFEKESSSYDQSLQPDINLPKVLSNSATSEPDEPAVIDVSESIPKPTSANNSGRINNQPNHLQKDKEANISGSYSLSSNNKDEIAHGNEETKNQSTLSSEDTGSSEVVKPEEEESSQLPVANNFDKKNSNSSSIIRPSSVRPSSSRPGAPRIRDKSDNVLNDAENIIVGKVNIISENALHEEEEDTNIIIENYATEELHDTSQNQEHHNVVNQNSHLVQQILDSQREFSQLSGKTEIEWQFGVHKAPDIYVQEMEQLKFSVQALSRIANPLGKLLDHIQEDVEVMRQELQQWTQLYEETSKDLLMQKNLKTNGELITTDEIDRAHNNYLLEDETFPEALAPTPTPRSPEPKVVAKAPQKRTPALRQKSPVKPKPPVAAATPPRRVVSENTVLENHKPRGAMQRATNSVPKRNPVPSSQTQSSNKPRSTSSTNGNPEYDACAVCGRRFAPDRLPKHQEICKKAYAKKRKPFDALKHRLAGTEAEPFISKLRKGTTSSSTKVAKSTNSNWRQKHEEFIQAIRAAKQVQAHLNAGGKLSDLPPPPPSENPDYVQCPHCNRRFNQGAAERHIPKCANFQFNKPKPAARRR